MGVSGVRPTACRSAGTPRQSVRQDRTTRAASLKGAAARSRSHRANPGSPAHNATRGTVTAVAATASGNAGAGEGCTVTNNEDANATNNYRR